PAAAINSTPLFTAIAACGWIAAATSARLSGAFADGRDTVTISAAGRVCGSSGIFLPDFSHPTTTVSARARRHISALAELEPSARGLLAVLLALLLARIASDVARRLELRAKLVVDLHQ